MKILFTLTVLCFALNTNAATYMLLSQTNAFAAGITNAAKAYADTKAPLASPALTGTPTINGQSVETQLTNKVAKAGDTMTGQLTGPSAILTNGCGIGTIPAGTNATAKLFVYNNDPSAEAIPLQVLGEEAWPEIRATAFHSGGSSHPAGFSAETARGTMLTPTVTLDGDHLGYIEFGGWNQVGVTNTKPTQWAYSAFIRAYAKGNYSGASKGSELAFEVTPSGSLTRFEGLRINNTGGLTLGGTTPNINVNTTDGSDTLYSLLCGGGGSSDTRGGFIQCNGNEKPSSEGGIIYIGAGNVSSGSIRFLTGGSERARIDNAGLVGIKTTSPTSTLHVAGSMAQSVAVGGAFTLTDTNDVYFCNADAQLITLPTAVGHRGRRYEVWFVAPATGGTITNVAGVTVNGATSISITGTNRMVLCRSDGTNWYGTITTAP